MRFSDWKAHHFSDTVTAMKQLAKVLIVFKKSTFQIQAVEHRDPRFLKLIEEGHSNVAKVKTAHDEHYETLEALQNELTRRGIKYDSVARADLGDNVDTYDLVISVGGDGTFLDASHAIYKVPLLGVNSARSSSFGHFCLANLENFSQVLDDIAAGNIEPWPLLRLQLILNGTPLAEPVLNEVLVCHSNPAGTSRYSLSIGDVREEQRSSGVLIGTPSGSTGTCKSAGGEVMPIISQQYQYIVREPWTRPGQQYVLSRAMLDREQEIHMTSIMRTGALYIDGQHIDYSFSLGDELVIRATGVDLNAYIDPRVNDIFRQS
jgi:NAD+ kinase